MGRIATLAILGDSAAYGIGDMDSQGNSALALAITEKSLDVIKVLVDTPSIDLERPNLAGETPVMMLAYNDGDIVTRIKKSILLHDGMRVRFSRLLGSENEVDNQLILSYIIERYANMRGTYFVKHLKGNSGNQIQKLADSQATRTKVAHSVIYAKKEQSDNVDTFISDDTPECRALWETATDNVFNLADTDDDDSCN